MRKNIVSTIITLLILAAAGLIFSKLSSQKKSTVAAGPVKKERRTVKYSNFSSGTATNSISIDGRLQAHDRVSITSKVQGIMQDSEKSMREGMYFKKGDLLFSLDNREASFNLKAQRANMMSAITQMMPDLKFDYPASFENWQKYLDQFEPDQTLRPLPEPVNKQEQYFVSGRNIYNQYYTIKSLETRLSDYNIYAPFSGILTAVNVFPGALISPGQVLATMINTSTYEIEAPIPYDNLKYVKVGTPVDLSSMDASQSWKGRVSRIGSQIDPATQNIPIYISVSGRNLKDGMYLNGELKGKPLDNVSELPKSLFVTPSTVYVIQDSTLMSREVQTIKRSDDNVYIRGLNPDEKVVTSPLAGLFEGQKINY